MTAKNKNDTAPPPTSLVGRFIRHILHFFVGLGVGLAPFLGNKDVPGFRALISVMPFQIVSELITFSAFLMGMIVVAIQFYSREGVSPLFLRRLFGIALAALVVGFVLFRHLRIEYTVDVERGARDKTVAVLIGSSPPKKSCNCPDPEQNPEECIQRLSFSSSAITTCWDGREIRRRGEILGFSYLLLTGGVGVLVGLLLLQRPSRRAQEETEEPAEAKVDKPAKKSIPARRTRPKRVQTTKTKATPSDPEQPAEAKGDPKAGTKPPEPEVLP